MIEDRSFTKFITDDDDKVTHILCRNGNSHKLSCNNIEELKECNIGISGDVLQECHPTKYPFIINMELDKTSTAYIIFDAIRLLQVKISNNYSQYVTDQQLEAYFTVRPNREVCIIFNNLLLLSDQQKKLCQSVMDETKFKFDLQIYEKRGLWVIDFSDAAKHWKLNKNIINIKNNDILSNNYSVPVNDIFELSLYNYVSGVKQKISAKDKSQELLSSQLFEETSIINTALKEDGLEMWLTFLSKKRLDKVTTWEDLGKCIFNITKGSRDGLKLWYMFCDGNFRQKFVEEKWNEWTKNNTNSYLTLKTIKYWAECDSPERYNLKLDKDIYSLAQTCATVIADVYECAKVVATKFENKYICSDSGGNAWWQFKDHRWNEVDDENALIKDIVNIIPVYFNKVLAGFNEHFQNVKEDENAKNICQNQIKNTISVIKSFKSPNGIHSVIKMLKILLYDVDFTKKKNFDDNKFCVPNGVINLENNELTDGYPEQYITVCGGCKYIPYGISLDKFWYADSKDLPFEVSLTRDFLKKVLVDQKTRDYFLSVVAISLRYGNGEKLAPCLIGKRGNNGKTTVFTGLVAPVFGEKAKPVNTSIIYGKSPEIGKSVPELVCCEDANIIYINETNVKEKINSKTFKALTGNDPFLIRNLYEKKMREVIFRFTLFFITNNELETEAINDKAMVDRITYIDFGSQFLDNPPIDEKEQFDKKIFKKDINYKKYLRNMYEPFLYLLTLYHQEYRMKGLIVPDEVKAQSAKHKNHADMMFNFINEKVLRTPDAATSGSDIYKVFKLWCQEIQLFGRMPGFHEVLEYLTSQFGEVDSNGCFKGVSLKMQPVGI